ncbi:MAG: ABC transporter substrate-binding protein [Desulfobulbaceae bacterium]|nr:ABC transporter substrate-binding protein [Desulfobulbaceae bacterium]
MQRFLLLLTMLLLLPTKDLLGQEEQITITDSSNESITLTTRPARVVSLVPSVTEMLLRIGAGKAVLGVTHHDIWSAETAEKELVGGFFNPDLERVAALKPDTIFYASIQDGVVERFAGKVTLINLSASSISESFDQIRLLGKIFGENDKAEKIIVEQQRQLAFIEKKIARIPQKKRMRTVRLMGRDKIMVPGDDSFQNEYIKRAGGIAPQFGENGSIIEPDLAKWQEFNPQVIYGCGGDRQVMSILSQPGWGDVDAVRNNRIIFFPCDLTCRASTHTGYFVSWLAARLYEKEFADPEQLVLPAKIVQKKELKIDYDYVAQAEKVYSDILDFRNKSVLIKFKEPMTILSTLEGWRQDISFIGNHYFPPPSWGLGNSKGLAGLRARTLSALELRQEDTAMLFTGADIDYLAVATVEHKEMKVTALVTAGIKSNAVRMARDVGAYYELDKLDDTDKKKKPGTINTILLTNTTLSKRAMTRALISAVEAKSAALQDLDIRSTATPGVNPATGTGTDNILIVQGTGPQIDATGGHTKMGELIARAVYDGVIKAVAKQNGITSKRSIFARLKDRKTNAWQLSRLCGCGSELGKGLEQLLLQADYSSFVASSFAISDHYERGLVTDLGSFDTWCRTVASQIAGKEVDVKEVEDPDQPLVMRKALGALVTGLQQKEQ